MGPYRVERQTQGGSYALAEMDGTMLRHNVAAYRLIPYIQRQDLDTLADEIGITSDSGESSISDELEIAEDWSNSTDNSKVSSHE